MKIEYTAIILKIVMTNEDTIYDLHLNNGIIISAFAKQKNVRINSLKIGIRYTIELALLENSFDGIHYALISIEKIKNTKKIDTFYDRVFSSKEGYEREEQYYLEEVYGIRTGY